MNDRKSVSAQKPAEQELFLDRSTIVGIRQGINLLGDSTEEFSWLRRCDEADGSAGEAYSSETILIVITICYASCFNNLLC